MITYALDLGSEDSYHLRCLEYLSWGKGGERSQKACCFGAFFTGSKPMEER